MTGETDAGYEGFKDNILEELRDLYGADAGLIETVEARGDNGQIYECVRIVMNGREEGTVTAANLHDLYMKYASGKMDLYGCIEAIYREREKQVRDECCND